MKITRRQLRQLIAEAYEHMEVVNEPQFPAGMTDAQKAQIQRMYDSENQGEINMADSLMQGLGYEGTFSRDLEDYEAHERALEDIEAGYGTTSDPFSMAGKRRGESVRTIFGPSSKDNQYKVDKGVRQQKRYNRTRAFQDADMHLMTPEERAEMLTRLSEPVEYDGPIELPEPNEYYPRYK